MKHRGRDTSHHVYGLICDGALVLLLVGGLVGAARLRRRRHVLHHSGGALGALCGNVLEVLLKGRLCHHHLLFVLVLIVGELGALVVGVVVVLVGARGGLLRGRRIVARRLALACDLRATSWDIRR